MQVTAKNLSDTHIQLKVTADAEQLKSVKQATLEHLAADVKLPGFRAGKAPASLIEKNINPASLQTEFLDRAMNLMYAAVIDEHKLRPVAQPQVKITKFVPFDALELEFEVEVVGAIKLPDYKKIKKPKVAVKVTAKDVDEVLDQLKKRESQKEEVQRAAKTGDEVVIDFKCVDSKTKEPIKGADGQDYPLLLGSNTFIPGFEDKLIGQKPGSEKTFVITFPKDYGVASLQGSKVEFTVQVKKILKLVEPKLDDAFAAKVGPFKTVEALKDDIKKQLHTEKQYQADRDYADALLADITGKAKAAIPDALITEQLDKLVAEQKQNLLYRGQTWDGFLAAQGLDEAKYRAKIRPDAELRVKAGLVLGEIAEEEKIVVTPEELEVRLQLLKARYPDAKMQAELAKPSSRREIASRMISEKTIDKLVGYATAKAK